MTLRVVDLNNFQQFTAINVLSDAGHIGGPVVIPNCVRVVIVWNLTDGKQARNVLATTVSANFQVTATVAETLRAGFVVGGNWSTLAAFMPTTSSLAAVELVDIRGLNNAPVISTGAPTPGTSASPALPSETAICVTLRTAKAGIGFRGRMYVPNFATNALGAGDQVNAATITALNTWVNQIKAQLDGQSMTWSLAQPARAAYTGSTGTAHPARSAGTVPLTSWATKDNHWDSQRRRGLK
jgi:hypothetical protein